ncbi:MAG: N-acetyltransferase [Acidobacteria bacterium]|nr:MAG: N-acetyltransferase [Acidobacteriota bacterium]
MQEPLPVLMGRRILLREPREGDAAPLFEHTSDPEVTRFLAFDPPSAIEETELFIARAREYRLHDREYIFVIADVGTDVPLGVTALRHLDLMMSTAQIGTWVARPHWGSGVNGEAKQLLLDYAFDALGLHRIEARIPSPNARSRRAFEKLGAVCEGTLRESFLKHGQYHDTHLYVVLSSDWDRVRNSPQAATTRTLKGPRDAVSDN